MTGKRLWFITGAGRGMGASFVHAALDAGDAVVATARRAADVRATFRNEPDVLGVALDVTSTDSAATAVDAAVARFGRIDVLVNSAAQDGQQPGDPDKLARALVAISNEQPPPRRFIAGADVIGLADRKIAELREDIESHRDLSQSLTFTD